MKIAQILRTLADTIEFHDSEQLGSSEPTQTVPSLRMQPVEPLDVSSPDSSETMVPPLQLKLELLKKVAGVESIFDQACQSESDATLENLKRQSGISTIFDLESDSPLES